MMKAIPIDTKPLFKPLNRKLLTLLKSLSAEEWQYQTVAKKWKVKDVANHMLDTQLRVLSIQRDGYFGEAPPKVNGYEDMVHWLNQLNDDWVVATRRLSPSTIILLLESIGDLVSEYFLSLDPWEKSIFPVAWAGQSISYNWMHIAREYTEYWHHQQQIRAAVGKEGIMTRELFYPFINTFFQALPHTFKEVPATEGTVVKATITSNAGGDWYLRKTSENWTFDVKPDAEPQASVVIPIALSWVLFSKSVRPDDVIDKVILKGDLKLAKKVLEMVAVMA